jgi:hypothetical protein
MRKVYGQGAAVDLVFRRCSEKMRLLHETSGGEIMKWIFRSFVRFIVYAFVCTGIYMTGLAIAQKISALVFTDYATGYYFIAFIFGIIWAYIHEIIAEKRKIKKG